MLWCLHLFKPNQYHRDNNSIVCNPTFTKALEHVPFAIADAVHGSTWCLYYYVCTSTIAASSMTAKVVNASIILSAAVKSKQSWHNLICGKDDVDVLDQQIKELSIQGWSTAYKLSPFSN